MMKVDILEAHDRYKHFTTKHHDITECCDDLIKQRPFGDYAFYIFAHPRTLGMDERFKLFTSGKYKSMEEVPEKTLIWQPRLTKPKAQTNSMLFKGYPGSDTIKILWIIPPREMWGQYQKGNVTESTTILDSINNFEHHREELEKKESDDFNDEQINAIYNEISINANYNKRKDAYIKSQILKLKI